MTDNTTQTAAPAATQATETAAPAATAPTAAPTPVTLHVNDIVNGTILLRVAIERGAFKAEEVGEVGAVYNKLNSFVQYLQSVAQAESQATAKAETAKTEATTETKTPAETKKKKNKKSN